MEEGSSGRCKSAPEEVVGDVSLVTSTPLNARADEDGPTADASGGSDTPETAVDAEDAEDFLMFGLWTSGNGEGVVSSLRSSTDAFDDLRVSSFLPKAESTLESFQQCCLASLEEQKGGGEGSSMILLNEIALLEEHVDVLLEKHSGSGMDFRVLELLDIRDRLREAMGERKEYPSTAITEDDEMLFPPPPPAYFPSGAFTCPVCEEPTELYHGHQYAECGHVYCSDCVREYYTHLITSAEVESIVCMAPGCTTVVDVDDVRAVVSRHLFKKFQHFLVLASMRKDPECRWCPRCSNPVPPPPEAHDTSVVACECGALICWGCRALYHPGSTCAEERKSRAAIDADTLDWLRRNNCKPCPHCGALVFLQGGCPHLVCKCGCTWNWNDTVDDHAGESIVEKVGYMYPRLVSWALGSTELRGNNPIREVVLPLAVCSIVGVPVTIAVAPTAMVITGMRVAYEQVKSMLGHSEARPSAVDHLGEARESGSKETQ